MDILNETRSEVYISDFTNVNEKEHISSYSSKSKWECVSYETNETKGTLLIASKESYPEPVTINPNLKGWYKIYVCLGEIGGGLNHIDLKLSGDEFSYTVSSARMGKYSMWITTENAEESFWKCSDMTGKTIIVSKPFKGIKYSSNIYWLRFVPMNEDEVMEYKNEKPYRNMFVHMDGDFHINDITKSPHDYCKSIFTMKDSDAKIICMEVINDLVNYSHPSSDYVFRDELSGVRESYFKALSENRNEIYKELIDYSHKYDIQLFAGHRMQLSNFSFPFNIPIFHIDFVDENKDKRCIARDGTIIDFLSYGYNEVQDYMIEKMLESAKQGFDGVLNIWTRGIHLLFEKPVRDRYIKKYGIAPDISVLPETDKRLISIRCDIICEFYKKARKAFNDFANQNNTKPMKIYLTGCFDVQSNLNIGIDIERLSKEGLIDGVIQSKMKYDEEIQDTLDDNGLIDLEKYIEKAKTKRIIYREPGSLMDVMADGTKEYRTISDKYGIDYYSEIQWETYKKPEEYVNGSKLLFSSYAKGISLWDCYPNRTNILSEWNSVSHLGNKEKVLNMSEDPLTYHKICKVLSYNGLDIRYYDPSWRG